MQQNYVDFCGSLPRIAILSTRWEYMTNGTEIAEPFWYDILPKASARDGKTMVTYNFL